MLHSPCVTASSNRATRPPDATAWCNRLAKPLDTIARESRPLRTVPYRYAPLRTVTHRYTSQVSLGQLREQDGAAFSSRLSIQGSLMFSVEWVPAVERPPFPAGAAMLGGASAFATAGQNSLLAGGLRRLDPTERLYGQVRNGMQRPVTVGNGRYL